MLIHNLKEFLILLFFDLILLALFLVYHKKFEDKQKRENDKMVKGYLIDGKIKIKLEK